MARMLLALDCNVAVTAAGVFLTVPLHLQCNGELSKFGGDGKGAIGWRSPPIERSSAVTERRKEFGNIDRR
jgi:hypothetical protein